MKSKTRRKMTFRRLAYYLLITAIVVSCVTNGIFAKFTTEDAGGDGARVAKFGIVLNIAGDLFSNAYYNANQTGKINLPAPWSATDDTVSVRASATTTQDNLGQEITVYDNVLAPGTKSANGIVLQLKGSSEADFVLDYETSMNNIFLHVGSQKSYGVMVPLLPGTIAEHNYEEFKNTLYIITETKTIDEQTENTYTKVSSLEETDPKASFDKTATYYQIEDEVKPSSSTGSYMPLIFTVEYKDVGCGKDFDFDDLFGYIQNRQCGVNATTFGVLYDMCTYLNTMGLTETEVSDEFDPNNLPGCDLGMFDERTNAKMYEHDLTAKGSTIIYQTNRTIDGVLSIQWEWPFEHDENGLASSNFILEQTHAYDTILGHIMAENNVVKSIDDGKTYTDNLVEGTDYNVNFEFTLDVTANQVD